MQETLARAGLEIPVDRFARSGGRSGFHTEHLGLILAEMQWMQRSYPGVGMVTAHRKIGDLVAAVPDPELPWVTIAELGVLRGARTVGDRAVVEVTPTWSGCPAMDAIRDSIKTVLREAGFGIGSDRDPYQLQPSLDNRRHNRGRKGEAQPIRHRSSSEAGAAT